MPFANELLEKILDALDIPPSHYERAVQRYQSLGEWLCRPESSLRAFNPAVSSQGSFRLGTVNRPLLPEDEYDLDTVCTLTLLTKQALTQEKLKVHVGAELESYRKAYQIQTPLEERKRCWRMDYKDDVSFHIDCLPCLPEDPDTIAQLASIGISPEWAQQAIAITCKTHPCYTILCNGWPTSNPGGYAQWFEYRFRTLAGLRRKGLVARGFFLSIEQVPLYALKTPLQRSIQFYKRHRDVMFRDHPELKPISMIITTLAALAYTGQETLYECLRKTLIDMPKYIRPTWPRVPNPVNPGEDFADKWRTNPQLESNFWIWHKQALRDVDQLVAAATPAQVQKLANERLGVSLSTDTLKDIMPRSTIITVAAPAVHLAAPPKPWGE